MPRRVTSPKRKKMTTKARIKAGSKEAKEWNLKMQELKRKKKEERKKKELNKLRNEKEKKKGKERKKIITPTKGRKKMESVPFSHGTAVL